MQGPIYKFYRLRTTEAFYGLTQAEKDAILAKLGELQAQHGVKTIVTCNTAWNNERWQSFGLEEFPDMQTVANYNAALLAMDLFRYVDSETMLGTAAA
jgi:hypothetical protein